MFTKNLKLTNHDIINMVKKLRVSLSIKTNKTNTSLLINDGKNNQKVQELKR